MRTINKRRLTGIGVATAAVALGVSGVGSVALAAHVTGTAGNDVLQGTPKVDRIEGRGGDDILRGLRGDDVLLGGSGDDIMVGGAGSGEDLMFGGKGRDQAFGGPSFDALYGGPGADTFFGGPGRDTGDLIGRDHVFLGRGNDWMSLLDNDGVRGFVDCGPGHDVVSYLGSIDMHDRWDNCEVLIAENPGD
ncbi:MAG TPA: hypothetical protein VH419_09965 [Nocardioidaceae bacterium]|jgi:Ca2+-binding RTX toxin-like protein